jgi:hypothetical protein
MRPRYFKIMLVIVISFGLLSNQGCMRIHFTGNSQQDKKRQGGHEEKKEELKAVAQRSLLDEAPRINHRGGLTIEIRYAGLTYREDLAFNVKMEPHSVKLGQYPLDKMSTLSNDKSTQVQGSRWEISLLTDHQVCGTIYFPSKDSSGNLLLAPGVTTVTLTMEIPIGAPEKVELGGTPKWIFQWNMPLRSEGEKTIEKIFWADNDGDMHVSFSALWRAIKSNLRQIQ